MPIFIPMISMTIMQAIIPLISIAEPPSWSHGGHSLLVITVDTDCANNGGHGKDILAVRELDAG
jgi:hypothetical protein